MRDSGERSEKFHGSPGRATLWAVIAAAVILVTVVLPAEYGIDWTGSGRVLGLTAMGKGKTAPAPTTAGAQQRYDTESTRAFRIDSIDVTLAPNAEIEYKAVLAEGDSILFDWDAGGVEVKFDFHGEPAAGPEGMFLTFRKGASARSAGTLRAPFTGTHGWYWKNSANSPVVIKLRVTGFHSELRRV